MYSYIFFDLDGTLSDSKEGICKSVAYALDKLGRPQLPELVLNRFIGPPLHASFMEYCGMTEAEAHHGVEVFRERYNVTGMYENKSVPGGVELLRQLKAEGRVLAVASSKPQMLCEPLMTHFGYADFLTVIAGSEGTADEEKADVIRKAMTRLGLTAADAPKILMVGDRKYDVLGAKSCGMDCVGVEFCGYAEPGELADAGAIAVVQTMAELGNFLKRH